MDTMVDTPEQGESDIIEVAVESPSFSFSAAHFIAYKGYREKLHGHNYNVSLKLRGSIQEDGYVVDFTFLKEVVRKVCKHMNEHFIVPLYSDVLDIQEVNETIKVIYKENAETEGTDKITVEFCFPKTDCILMPIKHSSVEEIGKCLIDMIIEEISINFFKKRKVNFIQLSLSESPTEKAIISRNL